MTYTKRFFISLFAGISVAVATAQATNDTINRMVLIESTYNPIIATAVKHNFIPEEVKPTVKNTPITYADESLPLTTFDHTAHGAVETSIADEKGFPGYIHFGLGNYMNLNGLAAYNLQIGKRQAVTFDAHIEGWNGKMRTNVEDYLWRSRLHDMGIGANYHLLMGNHRLNAQFNANRYNYNYLTYDNFSRDTDMQNSNHLNGNVKLEGKLKEHYQYQTEVGYSYFSRNSDFGDPCNHNEQHIYVSALAGMDLYEWGLASIAIRADQLIYSGLPSNNGYFSLSLMPQWDYRWDDFVFNTGLNLDILTKHDAWIQASPQCKISYLPKESPFTAAFNLNGGRELPTYANLYALSPYWVSRSTLAPSYTFLNAQLIAGVRVTEGLHISAGGGYKITDNALFETALDTLGAVYTCMTAHKAQVAYAEMNIQYAYKELLQVSASGTYRHWMLKGNQALLSRAPMLDTNLKGRARIIKGLYAHTDMRLMLFTPVEGYTTEKAIINISLGARYAINEHLSAFLDGHNLLNRHHQYYAGYPSQGISVMAGAAFKF